MPLVDVLKGINRHIAIGNGGFVRLRDIMPRLVEEGRTADGAIADAARVSYLLGTKKSSGDKALIRRLYRDQHTSPFEQPHITFDIRTDTVTNIQFLRHRMSNFNIESGRYSVVTEDYYRPDRVRKQSVDNKQGSDGVVSEEIANKFNQALDRAEGLHKDYLELVEAGVSRELARYILPKTTYVSMVWCIDLHNLLKFLRLRMAPDAQQEIREYANAIYTLIKPVFPVTCEAFEDYTLGGINLSRQEIEAFKTDNFDLIKNSTEKKAFMNKYVMLKGLGTERTK